MFAHAGTTFRQKDPWRCICRYSGRVSSAGLLRLGNYILAVSVAVVTVFAD